MPTYLVHGFRWHRPCIRIHVILNDLEDATPEWILAPATSMSILNSLYTLYDFLPPSNPPPIAYANIPIPPIPGEEDEPPEERPTTPKKVKKSKSMISLRSRSMSRKTKRQAEFSPPVNGHSHGYADRKGSTSGSDHRPSTTSGSIHRQSTKPEKKPSFNDWSAVKLLEQYDPNDMTIVSQPYAYVGDYMVEISLGVSIAEEMAKYETKIKDEEGPLSPVTPGTSSTPAVGGDLASPNRSASMSMRDMRRKSRRLGWFEKLRDSLQKGEDIGWHVVVCGDEERASPSMEGIRGRLGVDDDEQLRTPRSAGFKGFFKKRNVQDE
jgi:hypothetical protein